MDGSLFAQSPRFMCSGSNGNIHTSTDKKILSITCEISQEFLSPRMVWGHLSQRTVETPQATLEVLSVGRAPLPDGELTPHVLGGLRPSQEGWNTAEPTQPWDFRKPSCPAPRLREKNLTQRSCHACSGSEFRWDPKYQATVLTASRPNAYPGAETFLPVKLSLDLTHFHYKLQQWGSDIFQMTVQERISA